MGVQGRGITTIMVMLIITISVVSAEGMGEMISNEQSAQKAREILGKTVIVFDNLTPTPGRPFDYTIQIYNARDLSNMDSIFKICGMKSDLEALKCGGFTKGSLNSNSLFEYRRSPMSGGDERYIYCDFVRMSFVSPSGLWGSGSIAVMPCVVERPLSRPIYTGPNYPDFNLQTTSGEYIPADVVYGSISYGRSLKGDCDGDGYASTRDALMMIQMSVGNLASDIGCDMDGNGEVTSADAREVLKVAQGGEASNSRILLKDSGQSSGSGSSSAGESIAPIPLPNPQNLGIGGSGNEKRGATPITIPRVAGGTGGKGIEPIPLP